MIFQCASAGTIITNNLSVLLREQFASSEWRVVESAYLAGRLTVEESNRRQYLMIKEPSEVLQSFVIQNIRVRPGFLDFVEYCHDRGLRLAIVSSGLDFYIKTVLKSIGISDMEVYCARTLFGQDGITVQYIDPEDYQVTDGFKRRCFTWLRNQGEPIIYIGDGLSDLDVATIADHVFATDHLHRLLEEASVPHYQFFSFPEIMHQISRLALPG